MLAFIGRRLLLTVPVLFGIVFLVFTLTRLLPGDPCIAALQERATPQLCAAFNARFGLDQPIPVQFVSYVGDIATGNLGRSIQQGRDVSQILVERLPVTLELTLFALTFATVVGMTLGRLAARRRNSPIDVATMILANLGVLVPVVTVIGLSLGALLSGAVLTETIFLLPGVGSALFEAIRSRDYIVVQAFTIVTALVYVAVNLVVDISYAYLDPRIRLR